MENLNKVVKEIKIVAKPAKRGGKNYFVRVELVTGVPPMYGATKRLSN